MQAEFQANLLYPLLIVSAKDVVLNPVFPKSSKHIEIKYH